MDRFQNDPHPEVYGTQSRLSHTTFPEPNSVVHRDSVIFFVFQLREFNWCWA